MFRHGVRSWAVNFPNEPLNESIWDEYGGLSQLTASGFKQMTEFGSVFRDYYRDRVKMDATQVKAKCTYTKRTLQSSQAFLNGLFGNNSIPISSTPTELDNVCN